jgi:hypothetical protein
MKRLAGFILTGALALAFAGAAAAQSDTPDGRSYENHLTREQLKRCIMLDYEMANVLSLIDPRRQQMRDTQRELQQTDVQDPRYADLRTRVEQMRLQYNSLVEDYESLTERFNLRCTEPYYQVDYVLVKKELGYGWSSQ